MIPGEILPAQDDVAINDNAVAFSITVLNRGDRPIQVGSHYNFYKTNSALFFNRDQTIDTRLDIASGTAVRFEPGQERTVSLIKFTSD